ncbi:hypothetical protein BC828DRAFT_379924 [Blastocladiella britannica]|nr:hypothetical protein BC828DRAFT_379924 [Blastocladiella britannica]
MICYTSGTTGPPKGAVILHRNFIACSNCLEYIIAAGKFTKRYPTDTHFSYLPLAHVFEFDVFLSGVQTGMRSGFYQGDPTQLMSDIQELKPSSFITVPRVMNRIYDQVWSGVRAKGGITKAMFQAAFASKVSWLKAGRIKSLILDAVVFAKMRALLGGNIKFILCSSAPLAPDVIQFFRVCFSVDVFEGYGQTECSGAAAVTWAGDYAPGHVGTPNPCSEFKLFDVPSMNYTSADLPHPRGEICVRGNNVFQGYYKDPVKTAEAIDADGWLHTGDVGMWDERGRLVVIDRVKNLFKLSQGEYVSPERVESVYQSCPLVAQAYVHGDSLKSSTVGIMVPDIGELLLWAVAESFLVADPHTGKAAKGTDIAALLARQEVATAATKAVQAYGKAAGLKGFENVRAAHWEPEAWTVENNQLTPTFKLKRQDARAKYEPVFEALYKSIGE